MNSCTKTGIFELADLPISVLVQSLRATIRLSTGKIVYRESRIEWCCESEQEPNRVTAGLYKSLQRLYDRVENADVAQR